MKNKNIKNSKMFVLSKFTSFALVCFVSFSVLCNCRNEASKISTNDTLRSPVAWIWALTLARGGSSSSAPRYLRVQDGSLYVFGDAGSPPVPSIWRLANSGRIETRKSYSNIPNCINGSSSTSRRECRVIGFSATGGQVFVLVVSATSEGSGSSSTVTQATYHLGIGTNLDDVQFTEVNLGSLGITAPANVETFNVNVSATVSGSFVFLVGRNSNVRLCGRTSGGSFVCEDQNSGTAFVENLNGVVYFGPRRRWTGATFTAADTGASNYATALYTGSRTIFGGFGTALGYTNTNPNGPWDTGANTVSFVASTVAGLNNVVSLAQVGSTLYALNESSSTNPRTYNLYRSTDNGVNFSQVSSQLTFEAFSSVQSVRMTGFDGKLFFLVNGPVSGGSNFETRLYSSTDGQSFEQIR
ncbi:MAG: hypothetical protein MUF77_00360 [Leptospira sp.]|nr:hypothetical protein [Leptospira sp.]